MQAGDYLLRFPFRFHHALCLLGSGELGDHAAQRVLTDSAEKAAVVVGFNDGQGDRQIFGAGGGFVEIPITCLSPPVNFPNGR